MGRNIAPWRLDFGSRAGISDPRGLVGAREDTGAFGDLRSRFDSGLRDILTLIITVLSSASTRRSDLQVYDDAHHDGRPSLCIHRSRTPACGSRLTLQGNTVRPEWRLQGIRLATSRRARPGLDTKSPRCDVRRGVKIDEADIRQHVSRRRLAHGIGRHDTLQSGAIPPIPWGRGGIVRISLASSVSATRMSRF